MVSCRCLHSKFFAAVGTFVPVDRYKTGESCLLRNLWRIGRFAVRPKVLIVREILHVAVKQGVAESWRQQLRWFVETF